MFYLVQLILCFCACSFVVHTLFSMAIHALKGEDFLASIALISLWAQFLSLGSSLFRLFVGLLGYFAQKDW